MALRSGLRLGELLAVQWGDLDYPVGSFRCSAIWWPGNSQPRRAQTSTRQYVGALAETLEHRLTAAKAAALKAGTPLPAWVFTNTLGEPLDGDNVRRRLFEKALTNAKLRHI